MALTHQKCCELKVNDNVSEGIRKIMEEVLSELAGDATSGKQKAIREACLSASGKQLMQTHCFIPFFSDSQLWS